MNPKDRAALGRVPLELLPAAGRIYGALACRDGAAKYGAYNWREKAISLMGYTGAMERHLLAGQGSANRPLCRSSGHRLADRQGSRERGLPWLAAGGLPEHFQKAVDGRRVIIDVRRDADRALPRADSDTPVAQVPERCRGGRSVRSDHAQDVRS